MQKSGFCVAEVATDDNFFEVGYLLANPDVARSAKQHGHSGKDHFDGYGRNEGRRQITKAFLGSRDQKYRTFKHTLQSDVPFTWLGERDSFPVASSDQHFSVDAYVGGQSCNPNFGDFAVDIMENPNGLFLDIGCGVRDIVYENCLYVEVYPSIAADLIVPPDCLYPLKDNSFDGICCAAVLEHVAKPWVVVSEIHRLLKPGGRCYIDWPFLQPVHGYPSHYYNASREGLKLMFQQFEIDRVFSHDAQTPEFSLYWLLGRFVGQIADQELSQKFQSMTVGDLLAHPLNDVDFWKPFVKALPESALEELACSNCLIGRKPVHPTTSADDASRGKRPGARWALPRSIAAAFGSSNGRA